MQNNFYVKMKILYNWTTMTSRGETWTAVDHICVPMQLLQVWLCLLGHVNQEKYPEVYLVKVRVCVKGTGESSPSLTSFTVSVTQLR